MKEKNIWWRSLIFILISIAFTQLIRTAWIADDAAITLRCVLNFLHGYGPNFNIDERVQAYTHPLWFLLLSISTFIFDNVIIATYALSIITSMCVIMLLLIKSPTKWAGVTAVSLLILSKAYVDFSTSGLENPLSHLIIVLSILLGLGITSANDRTRILLFLLSSSSIYLSRPDLILLLVPWCFLVIYTHYTKSLNALLLWAVMPGLLWTVFSLLYYGLPFPNTAYAKLTNNIPLFERFFYGFRYFADAFLNSPITMMTVFIGLWFGFTGGPKEKVLAIGIVSYLIYVAYIGGDFMSGRFLTAPFIVAVMIIAFFNFTKVRMTAICCLILLGVLNINKTLLSDATYHVNTVGSWGIADERGFYYPYYGLLPLYQKQLLSTSPAWTRDAHIKGVTVATGGLGFRGLSLGPSIHVVDLMGMADPLLAHLPHIKTNVWRAGHFIRQFPTGYNESLYENNNQLTDETLAAYYETIRTITRGNIFTVNRLKTILHFNFSQTPDFNYYATLSDALTPATPIPYDTVPRTIVETGTWMSDGNIVFGQWMILDILLPSTTNIRTLDISLNDQQDFLLSYAFGDEFKTLATVQGNSIKKPPSLSNPSSYNLPSNKKLIRHTLTFEKVIVTDRIRIMPINQDDGFYGLGHLQVK